MKAEAGWVRVALAIALLIAVLAVVFWNERGAGEAPRAAPAGEAPLAEKGDKAPPAPAGRARDASRERPERERTGR